MSTLIISDITDRPNGLDPSPPPHRRRQCRNRATLFRCLGLRTGPTIAGGGGSVQVPVGGGDSQGTVTIPINGDPVTYKHIRSEVSP